MKRYEMDNILLDMDNTLVGWTIAMNKNLRRRFPFLNVAILNRLPAFMRNFVLSNVYTNNEYFWASLPLLHTNIVRIKEIIDQTSDDADVYICTKLSGLGNEAREMSQKRSYLLAITHALEVDIAGIIFVPNDHPKSKHFPDGRCLLIDDYHRNCTDAIESGHEAILIGNN